MSRGRWGNGKVKRRQIETTYPPIYKFGIISVRERETQQFHNAFSITVLVTVLSFLSGSDMVVGVLYHKI